MKITLRSVIAGVGVVLVSAVLAACAPMPADEAEREAQNRGSRLCIVNSTSLQMSVQWRGYPAPRDINPGNTDCNSGYERTDFDVSATIEYEPKDQPGQRLTLKAFAENIFLGPPRAATWFESQGSQFGACGGYYVNDEDSFQANGLHAKIVRVDDSESNKEFVLTLTEPSGQDSAPNVHKCLYEKQNPL